MVAAVNAATVDDLFEVTDIGVEPNGSAKKYSDLINALRHTGLTDDPLKSMIRGKSCLEDAITPLCK